MQILLHSSVHVPNLRTIRAAKKVTLLNNGRRSGSMSPREGAVQIKQWHFAEHHGPGPEPQSPQCDEPVEAAGRSGVCIGRFLQK